MFSQAKAFSALKMTGFLLSAECQVLIADCL